MSEAAGLPDAPGGRIAVILRQAALTFAIAGSLGTVAIMVLINADVIGRGVFSAPVPATAEIVSASIVAIVFLQLPFCTAMGRNVKSDMVSGRLRKRSLRAADMMETFHHAVGTVMMFVLLRYLWPEVESAILEGETVGLHGVFTIPRWPFLIAVLAGCALTAIHYALLTAAYARRAWADGEAR